MIRQDVDDAEKVIAPFGLLLWNAASET